LPCTMLFSGTSSKMGIKQKKTHKASTDEPYRSGKSVRRTLAHRGSEVIGRTNFLEFVVESAETAGLGNPSARLRRCLVPDADGTGAGGRWRRRRLYVELVLYSQPMWAHTVPWRYASFLQQNNRVAQQFDVCAAAAQMSVAIASHENFKRGRSKENLTIGRWVLPRVQRSMWLDNN
jgi:hypothetical protein